jgi:hypothetical protein
MSAALATSCSKRWERSELKRTSIRDSIRRAGQAPATGANLLPGAFELEESLMNTESQHVTLLTPPPPGGPEEPVLFSRVEQALQPLPGPWKVGLAHGVEVGWWIVTFYREDGFACTLFLDGPLQQTAFSIRDRLADALQRHSLGLAGRGPGDAGPKR